MRPMVNSATATAFAPGVFMTTMPRRVAASASMLSTPTPARPMTRSLGACSIRASSACTAERTTSASASANAAGRPLGSWSCVRTSHPGSAANTASVAGDTFSARTIFIVSPLLASAGSYSSKRMSCFSHRRSNMRITAECGLPSPRSYLVMELGCTPNRSAISYW